MPDFLVSIAEFMRDTQVAEQFQAVDVSGLFTNPYFLIPFLALVGHIIYRKAVSTMILVIMGIGLWVFSGSPYMDDLIVNGELQLGKVLPLAGVGVGVIGVVVYLLFLRSD
jgi:uncharacterized membrane protein YgdD (TMEM256/DUF423 family)